MTPTTTLSASLWSLSGLIVRPSCSLGLILQAILLVSEVAHVSLTELDRIIIYEFENPHRDAKIQELSKKNITVYMVPIRYGYHIVLLSC